MWDAVEADFFRDYGIDLMEQLDKMTWRRFRVLLRNINPFGAVAMKMEEMRKEPDEDDPETDKAQADAFFSKILSR